MPPSVRDVRDFVVPIVNSLLIGVPASDREDVCQETWIACWQRLSCQDVKDWRAYCARIAHHKVADWHGERARQKRHFESMTPEVENRPPAGNDDDRGLELERAIYLILRFFADHRVECFDFAILRYFKSLSWNEVADRVGANTEAVRQKWHRCSTFLLERIGDELRAILDEERPRRGLLE